MIERKPDRITKFSVRLSDGRAVSLCKVIRDTAGPDGKWREWKEVRREYFLGNDAISREEADRLTAEERRED